MCQQDIYINYTDVCNFEKPPSLYSRRNINDLVDFYITKFRPASKASRTVVSELKKMFKRCFFLFLPLKPALNFNLCARYVWSK